jgi:hypothetical protein
MRSTCSAMVLVASLALSACGGGGSPTATATPTPAATATGGSGSQTSFSYDVEPCFTQIVPNTGGRTVREIIVPDALTFDPSRPADFPNGRDLDDQTVDITVAFLFLDLTESGQSLRTFANLPLNPPASDRAPIATFPYLAPPQGNPPLAATTGTSFNFRNDPESAYVSVDRMGMPAIAPAVIGGPMRIAYNDAPQTADLQGTFRAELSAQLTNLMNAIGDDLTNIGLEICARRI